MNQSLSRFVRTQAIGLDFLFSFDNCVLQMAILVWWRDWLVEDVVQFFFLNFKIFNNNNNNNHCYYYYYIFLYEKMTEN